MVVAVQQPQPKEDPLSKIMKGIQVASGILTLKDQITDDPNKLTNKEMLGYLSSGKVQKVEPGTAGSISFKGPEGNDVAFLAKAPELSEVDKARVAKINKESELLDKNYAVKLQELEVKKRNAASSEQRLAYDRQENEMKKEYQAVKSFQNDRKVEEYRDQYQGAKQVIDLIQKGDAIGAQIALRNLFRLSGDVGAIRAEDLQQLGATPDLAAQVVGTWNRWVKGEPVTPEAKAQIFKSMAVIQENTYNKLMSKAKSSAKTEAANVRGLNAEDMMEKFNVDEWLGRGEFAVMKGPMNMNYAGENQGGIGFSGTAYGNQPLQGDDAINSLLSE